MQSFYDYLVYFWTNFGILVIYGITILALYLLHRILARSFRRRYADLGLSPDSANTIVLFFRIIIVAVAVVLTLTVISSTFIGFYIDPAWLISVSALIGTAVGLASAQALGNIVAGFYILVSRPFRIGDYVKIGNVEGITQEITLNHSKILGPDGTKTLIPNSKILSSEVVNYRVTEERLDDVLGKENDSPYNAGIKDRIADLISGGESFYIYTFDFSVKADYRVRTVRKAFEKVCRSWEDILGYAPFFKLRGSDGFRNTFVFSIIVRDPRLLLDKKGDFIEGLVNEIGEI